MSLTATYRSFVVLDDLLAPIVLAPLGGGPSTPELAAAVTEAGGLGFVAGSYVLPDTLTKTIRATRELTSKPFGVNIPCPSRQTRRLSSLTPPELSLGLNPEAFKPANQSSLTTPSRPRLKCSWTRHRQWPHSRSAVLARP